MGLDCAVLKQAGMTRIAFAGRRKSLRYVAPLYVHQKPLTGSYFEEKVFCGTMSSSEGRVSSLGVSPPPTGGGTLVCAQPAFERWDGSDCSSSLSAKGHPVRLKGVYMDATQRQEPAEQLCEARDQLEQR